MDMQQLLTNSDWVRALASSLVSDPEEADDIVQDTWVAALRRAPEDLESDRSWLRKVARNFAYLGFRSRSRRQARELVAARPEAVDGSEDSLERLEIQALLTHLVLELEEPYREVVVLRYFEGMTGADIARRLDIKAGAVRMRLSRALELIRTRFEERHGGGRDRAHQALVAFTQSRPPAAAPVAAGSGPATLWAILLLGVLTFAGGWMARGGETLVPEAPVLTGSTSELEQRVRELERHCRNQEQEALGQAATIDQLQDRVQVLEEVLFVLQEDTRGVPRDSV